jgi:excisionase family DNA binding protein
MDRLLLRPSEAAEMVALGRSKFYQMLRDGCIPAVIRIGRAVRISRAALEAWVAGQLQADDAHDW